MAIISTWITVHCLWLIMKFWRLSWVVSSRYVIHGSRLLLSAKSPWLIAVLVAPICEIHCGNKAKNGGGWHCSDVQRRRERCLLLQSDGGPQLHSDVGYFIAMPFWWWHLECHNVVPTSWVSLLSTLERCHYGVLSAVTWCQQRECHGADSISDGDVWERGENWGREGVKFGGWMEWDS